MSTIENKWIGGKIMIKPQWGDEKFWLVSFQTSGKKKKKKFYVKKYKTKKAALEAAKVWRKEYIEENGLMKNRYRDMGNHYEVEVFGGGEIKIGKISKEDLPIFEANTWYARPSKGKTRWYMCTGKYEKDQKFHRRIKPWGKNPEWIEVDHNPDRNGLNNLRSNLIDGGNGKNALNKKMQKNNKSGVNGVYLEEKKNGDPRRWRARWPENGKTETRYFPVKKYGFDEAKQMAIDARREADERLCIRNGYDSE